MVQNKLDSSQVWYIEIQEKSHSRSELLQQALCNAKIFGEDEVELMNWLNEVHDKLSKLSVQDYSTEGLWEQQSELRVFWFILFYFISFILGVIIFWVFLISVLFYVRFDLGVSLYSRNALCVQIIFSELTLKKRLNVSNSRFFTFHFLFYCHMQRPIIN